MLNKLNIVSCPHWRLFNKLFLPYPFFFCDVIPATSVFPSPFFPPLLHLVVVCVSSPGIRNEPPQAHTQSVDLPIYPNRSGVCVGDTQVFPRRFSKHTHHKHNKCSKRPQLKLNTLPILDDSRDLGHLPADSDLEGFGVLAAAEMEAALVPVVGRVVPDPVVRTRTDLCLPVPVEDPPAPGSWVGLLHLPDHQDLRLPDHGVLHLDFPDHPVLAGVCEDRVSHTVPGVDRTRYRIRRDCGWGFVGDIRVGWDIPGVAADWTEVLRTATWNTIHPH